MKTKEKGITQSSLGKLNELPSLEEFTQYYFSRLLSYNLSNKSLEDEFWNIGNQEKSIGILGRLQNK